jgi:hypothetical protein
MTDMRSTVEGGALARQLDHATPSYAVNWTDPGLAGRTVTLWVDLRGSGTHARYAKSCGIPPARASRSQAGRSARSPRTAEISDDDGAGTVFSCDQKA